MKKTFPFGVIIKFHEMDNFSLKDRFHEVSTAYYSGVYRGGFWGFNLPPEMYGWYSTRLD